jgi:alkylhydroperoxidase/carboxymuconolactone decarboxylase family protein YurZ
MTLTSDKTYRQLAGISAGRQDVLADVLDIHESSPEGSELDARTFALVRIAALIALDAPPASYARQIGDAEAAAVSAADIVGVLKAVAVQVGAPRVVAAAPEVMLSLGLSLPENLE